MKFLKTVVASICIILLCASYSSALTILTNPSQYYYGYGAANSANWTYMLDEASDDNVTVGVFTDLDYMLGFDAILLNILPIGHTLSSLEIANMHQFFAQEGKRGILCAENLSFAGLNNSITQVTGGHITGYYSGQINPVGDYEVNSGITSGWAANGSTWGGGLPLDDQGILQMYNANIVVIGDGANFPTLPANQDWSRNLAEFLGSAGEISYPTTPTTSPVPEPATFLLLSVGLIPMLKRKKRK